MRSRDSRVFVALLLSFVANGCKDKSVPPMRFQEARGRSNPWIRLIFLRLGSPFAAGLNPEPTCALLFHCAIVLNTLVKSGSLGQGQNTVADQPHGVLLELPAGFRPMNHVQRTPRGYDERR